MLEVSATSSPHSHRLEEGVLYGKGDLIYNSGPCVFLTQLTPTDRLQFLQKRKEEGLWAASLLFCWPNGGTKFQSLRILSPPFLCPQLLLWPQLRYLLHIWEREIPRMPSGYHLNAQYFPS